MKTPPRASAAAIPDVNRPPGWLRVLGAQALGYVLTTAAVQSCLSLPDLAQSFLSPPTYRWLLGRLGVVADSPEAVAIPWDAASGLVVPALLMVWLLGAVGWVSRARLRMSHAAREWGWRSGLMWCGLGGWEVLRVVAAVSGLSAVRAGVEAAAPFWVAVVAAGCMTAWLSGWETSSSASGATDSAPRRGPLWTLVGCYTLIFVTLNWRLYFNLYVPHGDSAMYEEHLWNLLHGKGFRSYLDQGLFLGEHIQVVHLALLPLYVLWPSHLLLELCESLALALGAFPVAWMTWRHAQSRRWAYCAAAAYLLYFPMQFLDIEIDIKTFRPEAFGIPLLLLTLDQLDRGRLWGLLAGALACLTVKEDYAIVLAPLGVWIAATAWRQPTALGAVVARRNWLLTGCGLAAFGVVYLWLATRVVIPWFRHGEELHYVSYFAKLGKTPQEILLTLATRPGDVAALLLTASTLLFALALLAPAGFVPLLAPGRLAVAVPLFSVLCLSERTRDPRHQFHAPLVALVFWAAAAGLARLPRLRLPWPLGAAAMGGRACRWGGDWLWASALTAGWFFSLGPLGLAFWDPGSNWHWRRLYGPTARGAEFARIAPLIPRTARVASTDFVHPRFTHHERSYDYSDYVRQVSGYQRRVPDDTDFIVIDTTHPYSRYHRPEDVPEYRDHADEWELLPDPGHGYFIVLKRRK